MDERRSWAGLAQRPAINPASEESGPPHMRRLATLAICCLILLSACTGETRGRAGATRNGRLGLLFARFSGRDALGPPPFRPAQLLRFGVAAGPPSRILTDYSRGFGEFSPIRNTAYGEWFGSPNGRWIARTANDIRATRLSALPLLPTIYIPIGSESVRVVGWASDSSRILFESSRYHFRDQERLRILEKRIYAIPPEGGDRSLVARVPLNETDRSIGLQYVGINFKRRETYWANTPDGGGLADLSSVSFDGTKRVRVSGIPRALPDGVVIALDGSRFYFIDKARAVKVREANGTQPKTLATIERLTSQPRARVDDILLSPSGGQILVVVIYEDLKRATTFLLDTATGASKTLLDDRRPAWRAGTSWSPDERFVLFQVRCHCGPGDHEQHYLMNMQTETLRRIGPAGKRTTDQRFQSIAVRFLSWITP
jgi:hypothetical protein